MLYILLILLIAFSKELIVINAEFVVIIGFITIFFILKSLLLKPIVAGLEQYSQKIRINYLTKINDEILTLDCFIQSIEQKVQIAVDLRTFHILFDELALSFVKASKQKLSVSLYNLTMRRFKHVFNSITILRIRTKKNLIGYNKTVKKYV
jgi:hypothetical protein